MKKNECSCTEVAAKVKEKLYSNLNFNSSLQMNNNFSYLPIPDYDFNYHDRSRFNMHDNYRNRIHDKTTLSNISM